MVIVAIILLNLLKVLWIIIFQATTKGYIKLRNWFHKKQNLKQKRNNRKKNSKGSIKSTKRHTVNTQIVTTDKSDKPIIPKVASKPIKPKPDVLNIKPSRRSSMLRKRRNSSKDSTLSTFDSKQKAKSKVCLSSFILNLCTIS